MAALLSSTEGSGEPRKCGEEGGVLRGIGDAREVTGKARGTCSILSLAHDLKYIVVHHAQHHSFRKYMYYE